MICPVCRSDMIVVERNRIELDHCTNCGGIWFDSGELDLLLASFGLDETAGFLAEAIHAPEARTSEKFRRCPVCSQRMRKASIGERPRVLIDACPRGDGIWFDGGELDQLLTEVSKQTVTGPEGHRRISDFLGDMFRARTRGQKS